MAIACRLRYPIVGALLRLRVGKFIMYVRVCVPSFGAEILKAIATAAGQRGVETHGLKVSCTATALELTLRWSAWEVEFLSTAPALFCLSLPLTLPLAVHVCLRARAP